MDAIPQLVRVEQDQAYVRLVSDHLTAELSPRDLRLVTLLVNGVTRWRRYLDFVVSHHYHGDMDKLEPAVLQVCAACSLALPPGKSPLWLLLSACEEVCLVPHFATEAWFGWCDRAVRRAARSHGRDGFQS